MPATIEKNATQVRPGVSDTDAHNADRQRRDAARKATESDKISCLDAETAAQYEARKPIHNYRVECDIVTTDNRGKRSTVRETESVRAISENDAWARFCTLIGKYPSPTRCNRVVKQLADDGPVVND